jgi:ABC-2 type transport system ATP-binding protein
VADRVIILARGRLVREGTLAELGDGHETSVVVRSPQPDKLAEALRELPGAGVTRVGLDELRVSGVDAAAVGHVAFVAGVELHELAAQKSDLEDIFFQLTADGGGAGVGAPGAVPAAPEGGAA